MFPFYHCSTADTRKSERDTDIHESHSLISHICNSPLHSGPLPENLILMQTHMDFLLLNHWVTSKCHSGQRSRPSSHCKWMIRPEFTAAYILFLMLSIQNINTKLKGEARKHCLDRVFFFWCCPLSVCENIRNLTKEFLWVFIGSTQNP